MSYGFPATASVSPGAGPVPQVSFQQPTNLFRFGEQTIWSTQLYQGGAGGAAIANTTNRIFTTPQGQQGQGFTRALSIAETNLKQGGQVPAGIAYDVFGIATEIALLSNGTDAAGGNFNVPIDTQAQIAQLLNVVHNTIIQWDFTQTQIDVCPVLLAGPGGGAFGAVSQNAAAANSGHMNNGNGNIWMYQKHPVALPGQTTFAIQLRVGSRAANVTANTSISTRVVLLGYYKNVIEIG
jgi:hypothetical protein